MTRIVALPHAQKSKKPLYRRVWFRLTLIGLLIFLVAAYSGISAYVASEFSTGKVHDLGPDTPATYSMPYENIVFKTTDPAQLSLRGWWIPRENSRRVLIMVHAKDGTRTFLLPISARLWHEGFNILMFDTRGQGQSDGSRYSFGWHERYDVVGAANFVKSKGFQPDSIGIVGWSMGAAIALQGMGETPDIKAAVTESSFGSLDRTISWRFSRDTHLPLFFYPGVKVAAQLLDDIDIDQTSPERVFPKLGDRKVFLIHTEKDVEVPVSEFYGLIQTGGKNIGETWLVSDSEHVRSFEDHPDEYVQRVVAFFNRELK